MKKQKTFGQMLRARREQWGESHEDIIERLRNLGGWTCWVSPQTVRNWESGRSYPCEEVIDALCDVLAFDFVRMRNKVRREKLERREKRKLELEHEGE